ncbi:hypothetical protein KKI17_00425 [Patescibacteria group bacterium]|nr:hypothetical protein [Patescibacteria group bacterium]
MAKTSTQDFLELEEIRDGVLVLKDRTVRGVLMVSSQNFALKGDEERQAIIGQFQNFLNSLDFTAQIVVRSSRLNITGYLEGLKELEAKQENELLRGQTEDYRLFIGQLIKEGSIMAKNFFVVVPFTFLDVQGANQGGGLLEKLQLTTKRGSIPELQFERMKAQLWQRMEYVASGLRGAGLQIVPLNTEELVELFWSWHHPEEAEVGYYPEIPPELLK